MGSQRRPRSRLKSKPTLRVRSTLGHSSRFIRAGPDLDPRRVSLALLPSPLHRLDRVSQDLGIELWIKRDDLNGLALGGNKARKIEYLLADALDQGAETVVTCGGIHSNFIRQLGAACAMLGLKCAAAVMDLPYEKSPPPGLRLDRHRGSPFID